MAIAVGEENLIMHLQMKFNQSKKKIKSSASNSVFRPKRSNFIADFHPDSGKDEKIQIQELYMNPKLLIYIIYQN